MSDHTYPMLGAVKPHVRNAALLIGNKFDIAIIYGIGARTGISDHPLGLAIDVMVPGDRTTGDQIADFVKQHWQELGVKYEIWWQRIDDGGGWEPMEDRGGITANHKDHVHVSFERDPGTAADYTGNPFAGDHTTGDAKLSVEYPWDTWFSGANLVRVFGFIVGVALIALVAWQMLNRGLGMTNG